MGLSQLLSSHSILIGSFAEAKFIKRQKWKRVVWLLSQVPGSMGLRTVVKRLALAPIIRGFSFQLSFQLQNFRAACPWGSLLTSKGLSFLI